MKNIMKIKHLFCLIYLLTLLIFPTRYSSAQLSYNSFDTIPLGPVYIKWQNENTFQCYWDIEISTANGINDSTGAYYDHTFEGQLGGAFMQFESNYYPPQAYGYLKSSSYTYNGQNLYLSFWYHMYGNDMGELRLEQFLNGNWIPINWTLNGQQQSLNIVGWRKATIMLNPASTQIRFKGISGSGPLDKICIDDIYLLEGKDLELTKILSPSSGDSASSNASFKVLLTNKGANEVSGFDLRYSIDGGNTYVTETFTDTIKSLDTAVYTFTNQANISSYGKYDLRAEHLLIGDQNITNNSCELEIIIGHSMSGNYTVGPNTYNDFPTLYLPLKFIYYYGMAANVNLSLDTGVHLGTYSIQDPINPNSKFPLRISGKGQNTILTNIDTSNFGIPIITLNNTSYVTIDSLSIVANDSDIRFTGISLVGNSHHHIIKNNSFRLKTYFNYTSCGLKSSNIDFPNHITISNNEFIGGQSGIELRSTQLAPNNKISNNIFSNQHFFGISVSNQKNIEINNNKIDYFNNDDALMLGGGISIGYSKGIKVFSNYMHGISCRYGFLFSYIDMNSTSWHNNVYNNYIHLESKKNISGYPIYNKSNKHLNYYNNTICITGEDMLNHPSHCFYNFGGLNNNIVLKNNIFYNSAGGTFLFSNSNISSIFTFDYNNIYCTGSNLAYVNGDISDMQSWRIVTGGSLHSIYANPNFITKNTPLTYNPLLNNAGTSIGLITTDLLGNNRGPSPDIGAIEFSPLLYDVGITELITPSQTVKINDSFCVSVKVHNYGTSPVTSIPLKYSFNDGSTYISQNFPVSLDPSSDTILSISSNSISQLGYIALQVVSGLAFDMYSNNDTLHTEVYACEPLNGNYFVGTDTSYYFKSFNQLERTLNTCGVSDNVIIQFDSANYIREEINLDTIPGTSITKRVILKGYGDKTKFIKAYTPESQHHSLIVLNGTKHLTIDSILFFRSLNYKEFYGVRTYNDVDDIYVQNCHFDNNPFALQFSLHGVGITVNDHIPKRNILDEKLYFINNKFEYGAAGIVISNDSIDINSEYLIKNNTFYNCQCATSILRQMGVKFCFNKIIIDTIITPISNQLIITNSYDTTIIEGNQFHLEKYNGLAIHLTENICTANHQDPIILSNNTILQTLDSNNFGLHVTLKVNEVDDIHILNNTLLVEGNDPSNMVIETYSSLSSSTNIEFKNNHIINKARGYAIYVKGYTSSLDNNNNNLFTNGNHLAKRGSSFTFNLDSLTDWQNFTQGGQHSTSLDPLFYSQTQLIPTNNSLNNLGSPHNLVKYDINGFTRDTLTPEIGAYEFNLIDLNLPDDTVICSDDTLKISLLDSNLNYNWSVNGNQIQNGNSEQHFNQLGEITVFVNQPPFYGWDTLHLKHYSNPIQIINLDTAYCNNNVGQTITALPSGGSFTSLAMIDSVFYPSLASLGDNYIQYNVFDSISGCNYSLSDSTKIYQSPNPDLGNDTTINWTNGQVFLDAGQSYNNWLWNNGWNQQTQLYDSTNLWNDSLNVIIVNVSNQHCSNSDTIRIQVINDVSIDNISPLSSIQLFPNPNDGNFNLIIGEGHSYRYLLISDLNGKTIIKKDILDYTTNINVDLSNLSSGMYLIKLVGIENEIIRKVIIRQ
jgi:hypothetical protein